MRSRPPRKFGDRIEVNAFGLKQSKLAFLAAR